MTQSPKPPIVTDYEMQELMEHQQMLHDVVSILATHPGERFIKYLFKHFEVAELPDLGLREDLLFDKLGSLRPGRALFRLISEAEPRMAGIILATVEKEKITQERLNVSKKV